MLIKHSGCPAGIKKRGGEGEGSPPEAGWGRGAARVGQHGTPVSLQPHLCTQAGMPAVTLEPED